MKSNLSIFALLLLLAPGIHSQDLKVMTYNIKYDNVNDTVNNWNDRKESMVKLIRHYEPIIFGMQEALHRQVTYIDSALTNYSYVGVGRDDGQQKGEYSPIHYDQTKLKVLKSNTFWLSPTPTKVSVGWDAAMERICTYALFEDRSTHQKFYVFNTHFDHIGKEARQNSAQLILDKIKEINDTHHPVVFMGDLNLEPEEAPIHYIKSKMDDGKDITQQSFYGPEGTFNGFDPHMKLDRRIDYIFVKGFKVRSYLHIDDRMENNKHISDHLPVLISIVRKEKQ
ncbi:MAG: endonuclease/exonuclease/phosphatase family protein [Maribacter sp.]|uniref:endonuclease/exonuclease/phosphatase family protein n=1 Tax=Maribacter sp. TaxID=1897614 RepID=UPI003C75A491